LLSRNKTIQFGMASHNIVQEKRPKAMPSICKTIVIALWDGERFILVEILP
jgi:hypothetical protein